jgi:hypothetical protein
MSQYLPPLYKGSPATDWLFCSPWALSRIYQYLTNPELAPEIIRPCGYVLPMILRADFAALTQPCGL